MDWNAAIERNHEALKRILATLVAMAGLDAVFTSPLRGGRREASGGGDEPAITPTRPSDDRRPPLKGEVGPEFRPTLPRHLYRAVLRLLRPAEAAARRLIIVAARGMVVNLPPPRKPKPRLVATEPLLRSLGIAVVVSPADLARAAAARRAAAIHPARPRARSLPLLDTLRPPRLVRRPPASGVPRILIPGFAAPFPVPVRRPPAPDDPIDTTRLALRFAALGRVLDDLPREARRFARWRARRDAGRIRRIWPLRPGRPPGHRPANGSQPVHEVHDILDNTHCLALDVLRYPDTS